MRIMISRLCLFVALLTASGVFAGDMGGFLVVPGRSVGPVTLGKPIPREVLKNFGKPTTYTKPSSGKEGIDTGNYYWEGIMNVKINDGAGDDNVFQVFIINSRYRTAKGIGKGSSFADVKKAYPGGVKTESMDFDFGWQIPGLVFEISNNQVGGMGVLPLRLTK